MSGGVDSAVALLKARPARGRRHVAALARSGRAGHGAGLLLARRGRRRPGDVPRARAPARDARRARGVPARRRRAVRARLRPRRDAEPVHELQRGLPVRAAARVRPQRRAPRDWRPATTPVQWSTGDGCCWPAAADPAKDQSYMLARLDPRALDRIWFPLGGQSKDETRDEAARAGTRRGAARREPGGVLPRRRRLPRLPAPPRARRPGRPGRRRGRARARPPRGLLAVHARPAARDRGRGRRAALRARRRAPGRNTARRRPARVAGPPPRQRARPALRSGRSRRGEAPLPNAGRACRGRGHRLAASGCTSTSPCYAAVAGQVAVLYEGDAVVGSGLIRSAT